MLKEILMTATVKHRIQLNVKYISKITLLDILLSIIFSYFTFFECKITLFYDDSSIETIYK